MAVAPAMHQIGPHTWSFEPPAVAMAPMKAHCRNCRTAVGLLRPEAFSTQTGNYVVRGECERCAGEVLLIIS